MLYSWFLPSTHIDFKLFFLFWKKHMQTNYEVLIDLTLTELFWQNQWYSFLVYIFYSPIFNQYFIGYQQLALHALNFCYFSCSLTSIYISANWMEREVWDLFGIFFQNHPDLRILLTDYQQTQQFPFKKDLIINTYQQTYV